MVRIWGGEQEEKKGRCGKCSTTTEDVKTGQTQPQGAEGEAAKMLPELRWGELRQQS